MDGQTAPQDAPPGVNVDAQSFAPTHHRKEPLSRQEQEAVIARGESVLFGGQIISHPHLLPSEAQLAKGDPAKTEAAKNKLQDQIDALNRQMEDLRNAPLNAPAPASGPAASPGVPNPSPTPPPPVGLSERQAAEIRAEQDRLVREQADRHKAAEDREKADQRAALLRQEPEQGPQDAP